MADFGIDTSVLTADGEEDLDSTFAELTGVDVLVQDIFKALTTPSARVQIVDDQPAPLLFWEAPPVSFDLRDLLNDSLSAGDESTIARRIERIYDGDGRFSSFSAEVGYDAGTRILTVTIAATASGLSFRLVLVADSNNVTIERV